MPTLTDIVGFEQRFFSVSGGGILSSNAGATPTSIAGRTQGFAAQQVIASGAAGDIARNHSTRADRVWRIYLKMSSAPSTLRTVWYSLATAGGRPEIQYDPSDGKLQFGFVGGTFQKSASSVNDGNWHRIDFYVDLSPNPRTFDAEVDGVAITQATLAVAGSTLATRWACGTTDTVAAAMTLQWDDIVVSDTAADYPIGGGEVVGILPASDGTHSFTDNDFSTGDTGTQRAQSYTDFHLMVDDVPPWTGTRSTTDNITQRVIRTTGYVEIAPDAARAGETANGVKAFVGYSSPSGTGTNLAGAEVQNSAPTSVVLWGDIGGTLQNYDVQTVNFKSAIVTKPAGDWTESEIEAIRWRVGGASDITPVPTWEYLMLEVDYPEAAAQDFDLTPAAETDTAQTLDVDTLVPITPAASTETAQTLDYGSAPLVLTAATSTETAQALNVDTHVSITPATSTETAAGTVEQGAFDPATETDTAQALTVRTLVTLGVAAETDAAQALSIGGVEAVTASRRTLTGMGT